MSGISEILSKSPVGGDIWAKKKKYVTTTKDPKKSGLEELPDDLLILKYKKKYGFLINNCSDIGLPNKGQQFRIITRRAFNAIDYLEYICSVDVIDKLNMAVYSINYASALILIDLVEKGRINSVQICMSNLRNGAHRIKEKVIAEKLINHPKVDIFLCSSHAKLISCATEMGNYYSIEGSGNHASNSRVEQYVIDNDYDVFKFSCDWMTNIREFLKTKKEYFADDKK